MGWPGTPHLCQSRHNSTRHGWGGGFVGVRRHDRRCRAHTILARWCFASWLNYQVSLGSGRQGQRWWRRRRWSRRCSIHSSAMASGRRSQTHLSSCRPAMINHGPWIVTSTIIITSAQIRLAKGYRFWVGQISSS